MTGGGGAGARDGAGSPPGGGSVPAPTVRRTAPGRLVRRPYRERADDPIPASETIGPAFDRAALWGERAAWPPLPPGTPLTLVKLAPDGSEVTRYPGTVVEVGTPAPWLAVRARWVNAPVDLDGLTFHTGDELREFFSPRDPFNVFAVYSPRGDLRGWYANVTHPTTLDPTTNPPTLTWHDLYLDVVALPDGAVTVRDEDELVEADLAARDPALHEAVVGVLHEVLQRLDIGEFPFEERRRQRG